MRLLHSVLANERCRPSMKNFPGYEMDRSLVDELEARGYDITTIKFSIQKKT